MIIPPIHGTLEHRDFFIYAACDVIYFDEFAISLVNSIKRNSGNPIHLHIFNPRQDQLDFCRKNQVSVTYEYINESGFEKISEYWSGEVTDPMESHRLHRIKTAMTKGNDKTVAERMVKTYYACARFIRLNEILGKNQKVFSMDVDAVVRRTITQLPEDRDFYMHIITGLKARVLAGGLLLTGKSRGYNFLNEYTTILKTNIDNDYLYWGLDQDALDDVVRKYDVGNLPVSLIDWDMRPQSAVWTAKGTRKDSKLFIAEKQKYIV